MQARSHRVRCTSAGDWSADRAPSLAGQLPQGSVYICRRLVGCQAAIAGRPAPTGFGVHLQEIGWLAGRHRRQASSHNRSAYTLRFSPLNRPSGSSPAALDLDPHAPLERGASRAAFPRAERRERSMGSWQRLVGWQGVIAGRPAPTGFGVHLQENGRLAGRHR